ncbi:Eukaryotic-type carbonic anhydrase, partial [Sarracenia purpurea var. burkii]
QIQTPEPINIVAAKVKNIITSPLTIFENGQESVRLNNTGFSVELIENEPLSANIITGGVLGLKKYVFGKTIFYWADSLDSKAFTTVDGKGSFENALNYRDGLAKICFPIHVGKLKNPLFDEFALYLKRIRKPNSSVTLKLDPAFLFYALTPLTAKYYAYPGSYTIESTGKTFYCTTTIVTPAYPYHFISTEQFKETFLSLLGQNGKPLVNNPQQVPRGRRPVMRSRGIIKIPNFIKVPTKIESL